MSTPIDDLSPNEKTFFTLTGLFLRKWSELELSICFPISALLKIDQLRARVILNSIRSFEGKRRLLEQLSATYGDDTLNSAVIDSMRKAKKLSRNRNMMAHHFGGLSKREGQLIFMTDVADDDIGMNFMKNRTIDLNTISQWAKTAEVITEEISKLAQDAVDEGRVYTSPKKHRLEPHAS